MVYHGPKAMEELVHYDPHLIVGILGGSAGTTYDAFKLLAEALNLPWLADDPRFTRVYGAILDSLLDQGVRKTLADLDQYREDSL